MAPHQLDTLADFDVIALCGDQAVRAKQRIVVRYLQMVYQQAHRVARLYNVESDDLVQAGVLGLYRAIERYDPKHASGATFMGFATWFVRTWCHKSARREFNAASRGTGASWEAQTVCALQDEDGEYRDGADAVTETVCDAHTVFNAIRAVPKKRGMVVKRLYLEHRTATEVAVELGVSKQRVHQLMLEGEAAVRDSLAPRRVA